jgi:hypothetical protein
MTSSFSRRATWLGIAASGLLAALPASASAVTLSGKPIKIATAPNALKVSVAVDPEDGTGYFAWANQPASATSTVGFCVVPKGATGCAHTGTLTPGGGEQVIDGVQVLVDGGSIVILADVFGGPVGSTGAYEPEQEWTSTDGGATWSLVNGGLSVADGILNADTGPLSAVIVPGTGVLGYGWDTAEGPPTFDAFPLSAPPECSRPECDGVKIPDNGPYPFAVLQPASNPDQIGNPAGSEFASEFGANPGVMGVFPTIDTSGPLGCSKSFGMAFVYGSGNQSAGNNYNLSPGVAGSAWRVAATQLNCDVEYPAVGGGPSGFGVLESDDANGHTVYLPFDAATSKFDKPAATINPKNEEQPSLSQDGAGGVYATYQLGGSGGPLELSYSGDAGAIWESNSIFPNKDGEMDLLQSAVGNEGQGWAGWIDSSSKSLYVQQFDAEDASPPIKPTKLTTEQTSGSAKGANISITAGTVGEADEARLSGTNAYIAKGIVDYKLYSDSACKKLVASAGAEPVTYGKPKASAPISAGLAPGKYYWQASYLGDVSNHPSDSGCGSEILTVKPPATGGGSATATASSVKVTIHCAEPCKVKIAITSGATTIATGHASLSKAGKEDVTMPLTGAGTSLLKSGGGSLTATLKLKTKTAHGTFTTNSTLKIGP